MSQKFRVKQIRIKSELSNRSGIVTENMTSATPDHEVGTSFKNVQVDENGEFVVGTFCSIDQVTQPQADTLTLEDLRVTVCGTGDVDIDGKTVSLDKVAGLFGGASGGSTAPIVGSSSITNLTHNTATYNGNIINNGFDPVTGMGFVRYLSGNPTYTIGSPGVTQNSVTPVVQSGSYTFNATGLLPNTNYCIRSYGINAIGTAYGPEICFTTALQPIGDVWFTGGSNLHSYNLNITGPVSTSTLGGASMVKIGNEIITFRLGGTITKMNALTNTVISTGSLGGNGGGVNEVKQYDPYLIGGFIYLFHGRVMKQVDPITLSVVDIFDIGNYNGGSVIGLIGTDVWFGVSGAGGGITGLGKYDTITSTLTTNIFPSPSAALYYRPYASCTDGTQYIYTYYSSFSGFSTTHHYRKIDATTNTIVTTTIDLGQSVLYSIYTQGNLFYQPQFGGTFNKIDQTSLGVLSTASGSLSYSSSNIPNDGTYSYRNGMQFNPVTHTVVSTGSVVGPYAVLN